MSSRNAPAQRKQQSVEDFLDEDELEEKRKRGMTLTVNRDCDALCCDVLGGGAMVMVDTEGKARVVHPTPADCASCMHGKVQRCLQ